MSIENDENPALKPKDLIFILAIAGRIDAQTRNFAKYLHEKKSVYWLYAGADSLSSSYSMFKYFFDICIANKDPNALHDAMLTPTGIIAITLESVLLVGYSVLAALYNDEKEDKLKIFIATSWSYFRHVIKGLKNGYKGWRSATFALVLLGGLDIKYLIIPVGVGLGVLAVANRLWMYSMTEARKGMMKENGRLLLEITELHLLGETERLEKLALIKHQELHTRICAYLSVGVGGFIDGLYLYVGVLTLAALAPPLLITMATISAFYTLSCIATRLYEEYDYQTRLLITQTQCKLALLTKQLETSYVLLLKLKAKSSQTPQELSKIRSLEKEFATLIGEFEQHRNQLKYYYAHNYLTIVLLGLKHGLYAYGALASMVFLTSAILSLAGVAFPPLLILICVFSGLGLISGFIIHSLIMNAPTPTAVANEEDSNYDKLLAMQKDINVVEGFVHLVAIEEFRSSLKAGLAIEPVKQYFYQEWFEVVRSFFSGVGKGQKFIDFAGNPLQELDELGHYQDTPIMYVLAAINGLLFAIVLGLRALARGFGRPPIGGDIKLTDAVTITVNPIPIPPVPQTTQESSKEILSEVPKATTEPIKAPHTATHMSRHHSENPNTLFNKSLKKSTASRGPIAYRQSETSLITPLNTAPGLE